MSTFPFNVTSLLHASLGVVKEAGALLAKQAKKLPETHSKGRIDLVADTGILLEEFLEERLTRLAPRVVFVAEESAASLEIPDSCWIVAPLDGTTNYAHEVPLVGISVALYYAGVPVLGIVSTPLLGEIFYAIQGSGAFCNGMPIRVSTVSVIERALVSTGLPYTISEDLEDVLTKLRKVLPLVQGIRRCGAAAVDLAWLACGRYDTFYEAGLKPWDIAAAQCILQEAGGVMTNMSGGPVVLEEGEVLASNGLLHPRMVELLSSDVPQRKSV